MLRTLTYAPDKYYKALHQNIPILDSMCNSINTKFNSSLTFSFVLNQCCQIGTWIDAKDTINQWLEAQIIDIIGNMLFIHYNGWASRWDEWIDINSPRIAPFRTYTIQYPSSQMLEPYPNIKQTCEKQGNYLKIPTVIMHLNKIHKTIGNMLQELNTRVEKHKLGVQTKCSNEEEKQEFRAYMANSNNISLLSARIASLFDRYGRIMVDSASLLLEFSRPDLAIHGKINRELMLSEDIDKFSVQYN